MKKIFFLAGLPRSGKNLLGEILNQNTNMFGLLHSPLCEMLWRQYNLWKDKNESIQYDFTDEKVKNIKSKYLKNFISNFYNQFTDKDVVFDAKRNWDDYNNIEMYRDIFKARPKIICCVRNVEDIMASFYIHYDKQNRFWDFEPWKKKFYEDYANLKDSYLSRYRDCLLIVEYNRLVNKPKDVLKEIYEFINEPVFTHDFSKLKKSKIDTNKILTGGQLEYYTKRNWWKGYRYR